MSRNLNRSKAGYNLRCKYYKPEYIKNERLVIGAEVLGVFYCKKISERLDNNFNGTTKSIDAILELETRDSVELAGDYFVELPNGLVYRVIDQGRIFIDDRSRVDTTITLRRRV